MSALRAVEAGANDPEIRLTPTTRAGVVQLMRLASRVAINRTVAGVHFPADSAAGCFLGLALGQYFWRRCTAGVATTYAFVRVR